MYGIRNLFFYPFSVKIMLKMHQKPFGGRGRERRKGKEGREKDERDGKGDEGGKRTGGRGVEGRGEGTGPQPDFLATPLIQSFISTCATKLMAVTSSNLDGFSVYSPLEISNKIQMLVQGKAFRSMMNRGHFLRSFTI